MATLKVGWKCKCGGEREADVPTRRFDEDVRDWMTMVQWCLMIEHRKASPTCRATSFEYAKIPYHEGAQLGAPSN